jgi:hypothetical protein
MAPSEIAVYSSETTIQFFRERAKKYMPVTRKIIDKVNILWKKLFNNSNNVLGVLARGTDYKYLAPGGHSKAPTVEKIIEDVKKMDANYTYDWIYLTTEDDKIKENFTKNFEENEIQKDMIVIKLEKKYSLKDRNKICFLTVSNFEVRQKLINFISEFELVSSKGIKQKLTINDSLFQKKYKIEEDPVNNTLKDLEHFQKFKEYLEKDKILDFKNEENNCK